MAPTLTGTNSADIQSKSQLVIHYAYQVREQSPNTYVFWVHASTRERFEDSYRDIATRLRLPGHLDPKTDLLRLVYNWLHNEEIGEWLMILDNADNLELFYPKAHGTSATVPSSQKLLTAYLPQSRNGRIIVTSRSRHVAELLTGSSWNVVPVLPMDDLQARQLLQNKLRERYDEQVAPNLVRALEYIPLAITHAAAYILRRTIRMSPSIYMEEFRKSDERKASLFQPPNLGDLRRDTSAANSVFTSWQITFEQIRRERRSAADLLSFMSFFNPQGIPEWVLRNYQRRSRGDSGASNDDGPAREERAEEELDNDLETLLDYSLVATTQNGMLEMHALVQACTRIWLSSFDQISRWRRLFLETMSCEYPRGEVYENWNKCRQLNLHIEPLLEAESVAREEAEKQVRLLGNVASYWWKAGRYGQAEMIARRAIQVQSRIHGTQHPSMLTKMDMLAVILKDQGKSQEAEKIQRELLDIRRRILGAHHPHTLGSIDNLGNILQQQGKNQEAEQMHREALDVRKRILGADHPDTLGSINNLGITLQQQGKLQEAEQMHREALDARRRILGAEHPHTLECINNLGNALQDQGRFQEAEQLHREALDRRMRVLGVDHPHTLISIKNLAVVLQGQHRHQEAEQLYREALDGRRRVLGVDHPDTLTSINNLAYVLRIQGRHQEAGQIRY